CDPARGLDLGYLEVRGGRNLVGDLRLERLERSTQDGPQVGQGQSDRVRVLLEDRAVQVGDPGPEGALEDAAAGNPVHDALDQRPEGDQVGVGAQDDVVGDPGRD